MKRTPLKRKGSTDTSKTKDRIQALCRQIALIRDGGCIFDGNASVGWCNGFKNDGGLVYQYDHLNSRAFNVSFADVRLGVILCKGHHGWKHFSDANKKLYDRLVREIIGPKRTKLWDLVEEDRKIYPMSAWDWAKVEIALTKDLEDLKK